MYLDRSAAGAMLIASACLLTTSARASTIKLAGPDFVGQAIVRDALFAQTPYVWSDPQHEETFLTLGHARQGQAWGFNTTVATSPQTIAASALSLTDVPTTTINGVVYRQFLLDVTAPAHHRMVSLSALNISLGSPLQVTNFDQTIPVYTSGAGKTATNVMINSRLAWQGGHGEVVIDILDSAFTTASAQGALPYVYLDAHFNHARGSTESFSVVPANASQQTSPPQENNTTPSGGNTDATSNTGSNSPNHTSNTGDSTSNNSTDNSSSSADPTQDPVTLSNPSSADNDHCGCTCHDHDPGAPATPEPGSAMLISAIGVGALLRRRRGA